MNSIGSISIIGPGKVGTSIAIAAHRAGVRDIFIGGRTQEKVEAAARHVEGAKAWRMAEAANHGDIVLLCVSDNEIELVAKQLAEEDGFRKGATVAHLSGALESKILQPAKDLCGAFIASAHPLKTFPSVEAVINETPSAHWFLEGDAEAIEKLSRLISSMGDVSNAITGEGKAIYHAASVVACNYLSALMDTALELMSKANVDQQTAWAALKPLVFGTLNNVDQLGPEAALTGPIARGDVGTIEKHKVALENATREQRLLYAALGLKTVDLAVRKGTIDERSAEKMNEVLKQMF